MYGVSHREGRGYVERNKLFLLFKNANVFTPAGLQEICKAEALFVENNQFAAGRAVNPSPGKPYPGVCVVRPSPSVAGANNARQNASLQGTFGADCSEGPIPLITVRTIVA